MLQNGTRVAGYEIEGILGHGGMGVVYEARQTALGRTVALKILAGTLGMDPSFKARFRNEGRIQAALDHPHIVTIFEAGEWDDSLFIAMRLVRGPNLKEMIIARELEGARTLRILRPIAEALDSAHEAGLIHRDIKPQNILVGARDRAYLADFGLTKGMNDTGLTQTGQFVGTIDYISPEQIRGEPTTSACDIYALSAVLYECLTGAVPYPKPSDAAVMYAHLSEPPPLVTEQRPELPPNLDEVICKAMDKDPAGRYDTATALIDEAEKALGKRVRAVITPPGPIEGPEEAGIREREAQVPTRPERLRQSPVPDPAPPPPLAVAAPTQGPAMAAQGAPPTVAAPAVAAQGAPPTVAAPAVERQETAPAPSTAGQDAAPPTVAAPAVEREAPTSAPPTVAISAAERGASSRRRRQPPRSAEPTRGGPAVPAPALAASAAPARPLPERAARRDRPSALPYAAAALALLVAALVGYLLGKPGDDAPVRTSSALSGSTRAGALGLRFPSGWERRGDAPRIPGLRLTDQVAMGPAGARARGVMAGTTTAAGPLLLPGAFVGALEEPPRAADRVRVGKVEALRYEGLEPRGFGGRALTVFAAPTSGGVATIACFAPSGGGAAFRGECERVAGTLSIEGETTFPVGADSKYATALGGVIGTLDKRRRAGRTTLSTASTRAAQSKAASGLANAYTHARAGLRRIDASPATAPIQKAIEQSLAQATTAYRRLGRARTAPAFRRASRRAERAEARVQSRLGGLKALGYAVG